ncbi:hypothetical protein Sme01_11610 [Sphaerisporangium melleum]|uniref:Uncharacterized protein n=1 Tax=Sphaerisporangium melleum TaxID=321316 RepID=A0A917VRP6_9ACTN|nr:hypothetical protein GCM10007964_57170 [Sphaerisporangium melleum]GII68685.1 hypothetical protein Sme01_11610 [Sphaerisporangium melleum]
MRDQEADGEDGERPVQVLHEDAVTYREDYPIGGRQSDDHRSRQSKESEHPRIEDQKCLYSGEDRGSEESGSRQERR